jgi:hypothetical protein
MCNNGRILLQSQHAVKPAMKTGKLTQARFTNSLTVPHYFKLHTNMIMKDMLKAYWDSLLNIHASQAADFLSGYRPGI